MQNGEGIVFEQTRDTEAMSHVRVCESCAHYVFNQYWWVDIHLHQRR